MEPSNTTDASPPKSSDTGRRDTAGIVAFCVCAAAAFIFFIGGSNWPGAAAVGALSIMGIGICYLVLK